MTILDDTDKMRRPDFSNGDPTGRVTRDDRGNAVWEWAQDPVIAPPEHPGLSVVDEEPRPQSPAARVNKVAGRSGYNPYESGLIVKKKAAPRKRDLRELSRWIEQRKLRGEDTRG